MKDTVFIKVECYYEDFSNYHAVASFETSGLKEVGILRYQALKLDLLCTQQSDTAPFVEIMQRSVLMQSGWIGSGEIFGALFGQHWMLPNFSWLGPLYLHNNSTILIPNFHLLYETHLDVVRGLI